MMIATQIYIIAIDVGMTYAESFFLPIFVSESTKQKKDVTAAKQRITKYSIWFIAGSKALQGQKKTLNFRNDEQERS